MTTPAGWYDDGSGRLRWWDGQQWTDHFAPETASDESATGQDSTADAGAIAAADASDGADAATLGEPSADTTAAAEAETAAVVDSVAAYEAPSTTPQGSASDGAQAAENSPWAEPASDAAAETGGPSDETAPADSTLPATDPYAAAQTSSDVSAEPQADWTTPGFAPPASPADAAFPPPAGPAPAYPSAPAYSDAAAYADAPAYASAPPYASAPGAPSAPAYPGGAGYPGATPGYQNAGTGYPGGGYPASTGYAAPAQPRKVSVIGLVGLGLAVLGTILSCIPAIYVIGWVVLAAGLTVSIVSLFLKGSKWPGFTGIGVSILGAILAFIMAIFFVAVSFSQALQDGLDDLPSSAPSIAPDDDDDFTDDAPSSGDVVEGAMGEPVTIDQGSGTVDFTVNSATWGADADSLIEPENGGYLVIDTSWTGVDGTTYANPFYVEVETPTGETASYSILGGDSTLEAQELSAGDTVQGTLSFDVAQSDSYVVIVTDATLTEVARITVEATAG